MPYIKRFVARRPLADNIDNCFFRKNGKLWNEFDHLYGTLFDQSKLYRALGISSVLTQQSSWFVTKRILEANSDSEEIGNKEINDSRAIETFCLCFPFLRKRIRSYVYITLLNTLFPLNLFGFLSFLNTFAK